MKTIEAAELSALLDGELSPERAQEVRGEIERNASLKAEFERLSLADGNCRADASSAEFAPAVTLPAKRPASTSASWVFAVIALAALRVFSLTGPTRPLAVVLNIIAFEGILLWIILLATKLAPEPPPGKHASRQRMG